METIHLKSSALKTVVKKAFDEVSQIFRHLVRSMVKLNKGFESVGSSLNSIWEVVTYFIDTSIDINKKEVEGAIENIKNEYLIK